MRCLLVTILLAGLWNTCYANPAASGNAEAIRAELLQRYQNHPATKLASYPEFSKKKPAPLPEDLVQATLPELLADYIALENQLFRFSGRPKSATLPLDFRDDVLSVLKSLPAPVRKHLSYAVAGICFADDLGSTGYAEELQGPENQQGKGHTSILVFDWRRLDQQANEWATCKENSPFQAVSPGMQPVQMTIEPKAENSRSHAFRYILLHELGHAAGVYYGESTNSSADILRLPFNRISWTGTENASGNCTAMAPRFLQTQPDFKGCSPQALGIRYYVTEAERQPANSAWLAWQWVDKTDFPSLYATLDPRDDFAETYAIFVHTILLNQPWRVEVRSPEELNAPYVITDPLRSPRLAEKRKFMEDFFARTAPTP